MVCAYINVWMPDIGKKILTQRRKDAKVLLPANTKLKPSRLRVFTSALLLLTGVLYG